MDLAKKKEELIKQYKENIGNVQRLNMELQRLNIANLQIEGQIKFIEEMEQQEENSKSGKGNSNPGKEENADTKCNNTTKST